MRKVYICSPYRAKDGAELDRNIDYAQQLTRQALEAGLAPITPHLYMTQCMDDKKPEERARGMAAGLTLLKSCDFVIAGVKYGITEGMDREIHTANMLGIAVIDANQIKGIWNTRKSGRSGRRAITQSCIAASFAGAANYTAARATIAESRTDGLMSMP